MNMDFFDFQFERTYMLVAVYLVVLGINTEHCAANKKQSQKIFHISLSYKDLQSVKFPVLPVGGNG